MRTPGTYHFGLATAVVLGIEVLSAIAWVACWWFLDQEVPAFRMERPQALYAMLGGPLLAILFLVDLAWRTRAQGRFAGAATLARMIPGNSDTRMILRFLLLRHALSFAVVALAGPQFGTRLSEVRTKGVDVVVAMDVSNSMACEDIRPSRMEAARRALSQLLDKMRGDRLGIVVFAGEAFVQLPITTDRSAAKLFLDAVDMRSVGTQGTAIGAAIDLARESFEPDSPGGKAIIVITDGENHEDDAEGAARGAAEAGIVVHTIGMGTPEGGPLPIRRNDQVIGFRKDRGGNTVVSRLNEPMLERIAAEGKGLYVRATASSSGLEQLVADLRDLGSAETTSYQYTAHEDQYQYPLAIGIGMVLIGLAMGERRHWRARWPALHP